MRASLTAQARYRERMENQPTEVVFCRQCVISNQRPRIRFDSDGVCSACHYAWKKHQLIDWAERSAVHWILWLLTAKFVIVQ